MTTETYENNIAESLATLLPKAEVAYTALDADDLPAIVHVAVPKNTVLQVIDLEPLLEHPRRTVGTATMADAESFVAYVTTFKRAGSTVWCDFDPASARLSFAAVVDEHEHRAAGWRGHKAVYTPRMSIEWGNWKGGNGSDKAMSQIGFAEMLEKCADDIASVEGFPTSLQLMQMATDFMARSEMSFKSAVRLQDGGVNMSYVADADSGTLETMKLFKGFAIGIPVFWTLPATDFDGKAAPVTVYRIDARLKYRVKDGRVMFWYELIRPDRVHQMAALELIAQIRAGIGDVPLRVGSFS